MMRRMATFLAAVLIMSPMTAWAGDASTITVPLTSAQQAQVDAGTPEATVRAQAADAADEAEAAAAAAAANPDKNDDTPATSAPTAPSTEDPATTASPPDTTTQAPATTTSASPAAPTSSTPPSSTSTSSPSTNGTPAASSSSAGGFLNSAMSSISSAASSLASSVSNATCAATQGAAQCTLNQAKATAAQAGGNNRIQMIATALSADTACWSCVLYETVYTGMRKLVDQSYAYFVGSTSGLLALVTTILSIAVIVRIMPIVLGTDDGRAASGLRVFFFRIIVVFSLFLGTGVVSTTGSFLSDWFIDGPLAAGTELGTKLAGVTAQAFQTGGGTATNPMGTDLSSGDGGGSAPSLISVTGANVTGLNDIATQDTDSDQTVTGLNDIATNNVGTSTTPAQSVTGLTDTNNGRNGTPYQTSTVGGTAFSGNTSSSLTMSSNASTGVDLGTQHVAAAKAILLNLHRLGVAGIVTGIWMATEGPVQQSPNIIAFVAMVVAGIMLAFMFFMFTITFGLRYIDALIRSMLIFSLMPIFAFLWIFDSTRPMAMKALKAGLSLAAVFAVSGVVFSVAMLIMQVGFQKAFQNAGGGTSTSTLTDVLGSIQGGGFSFLTGNSGSGSGTLNWLSFFILVGSCSLAIACAKLAFDLASQMFSFGRAELGIGKEVEGEVHNVAGQAKNVGLSVIGGR